MYAMVFGLLLAPAPIDTPATPKGPVPQMVLANMNEKGDLFVQLTTTVYQTVTKQIEVEVMGQRMVRTITETVPVQVSQIQLRDTKNMKAFDVAGTPLTKETLARRLSRPTLVLISADGKPLDPAYRSIFKDGIPVLIFPSPSPNTVPEKK